MNRNKKSLLGKKQAKKYQKKVAGKEKTKLEGKNRKQRQDEEVNK